MTAKPKLLMVISSKWDELGNAAPGNAEVLVHGHDAYKPEDIDYVLSFTPPQGLIARLPNLKAVFSLGAGVDGILSDPSYPKQVPLVRFTDPFLSTEMAQYVILHVLMYHRLQRFFDRNQRAGQWIQQTLPRLTQDTRVGLLGLGEIGSFAAARLIDLGFPVSGWSRSRKSLPGLTSFAGDGELPAFLGQSDILVCLLSLTRQTRGILDAKAFAALPQGAFVINAARGAHLSEADLIAALDSGHLSGAVLDVFQEEPLPPQSPLWHHAKVTVTPHIAGVSQPQAVIAYVEAGIAAFERGEIPANLVDVNAAY